MMRALTDRQLELLSRLYERGPAAAAQISGTLMRPDQATASLKRLAARGLVKRSHKGDVSVWTEPWWITDAGRDAVERSR